jgi:hypothetical protein
MVGALALWRVWETVPCQGQQPWGGGEAGMHCPSPLGLVSSRSVHAPLARLSLGIDVQLCSWGAAYGLPIE